jgi:hypothetical protein
MRLLASCKLLLGGPADVQSCSERALARTRLAESVFVRTFVIRLISTFLCFVETVKGFAFSFIGRQIQRAQHLSLKPGELFGTP